MTGRKTEASNHLSQALELIGRLNDQRHQEILAIITGDRLYGAAKRAVRPIGTGAERLAVQDEENRIEVDIPMAEALKARGEIMSGNIETVDLLVDGIIHSKRQLKVPNPDPDMRRRFSTAIVRDPVFDQRPNVYTEAASVRGWISADVKVS